MSSMSPDAIQSLAVDIARQTPFNWHYFVILGLLTLATSLLGAFFGSYMKKRGEQHAYTADFNEIKAQLRETTMAQETIRAEVHRISNRTEKLEWMKREKLERYVECVNTLFDYMKGFSERAIFTRGEPGIYEPHPYYTAKMLYALYLPELNDAHAELTNALSDLHDVVAKGIRHRRENAAGQFEVPGPLLEEYENGLDRLLNAADAVTQRASELAAEMNRPEQ